MMATYFFDCFDGRNFHTDFYGMDLVDVDETADHAACLAQALLSESSDSVGMRAVTVTVRSAEGAQVYVAHCTFHGMKVPGRGQRG
jgi:hypothetical protein